MPLIRSRLPARERTSRIEPPERTRLETYRSRVRGCLLGGAVGDASGGPVEFWSLQQILDRCGDAGVTAYVAEWVDTAAYGRITDDTQMTLFTMEGMIRASVRVDRGLGFTIAVLHHAYDRWLDTQQLPGPDGERDGWLVSEQWHYARRAPGTTCLGALIAGRAGQRAPRKFGQAAVNQSKGCGAVMRSAPFGLVPATRDTSLEWHFAAAAEAAGYTHGHPTGQLASGALAVLIGSLVAGRGLDDAVDDTLSHLSQHDHHAETTGLPSLLAVVSGGQVGSEATTWLILPWCAPAGAALVVPAALGAGAYLIGLTVGAVVRSPWPWVLGAWAAPLAYSAASRWLVDFACVA